MDADGKRCGTCIWAVPRAPSKSRKGAKRKQLLVCLVEACPTTHDHPHDSNTCHCGLHWTPGGNVPREWEPRRA